MREPLSTHQFWEVENTGWSGGISWFKSGGRIKSEELAIEYATRKKLEFNDSDTFWRVTEVTFIRYEDGDSTVRKWKII